GVWSGSEPICQAIDCGILEDPVNGAVATSQGTVFMSDATYTCNEGYRLVGSSTRSCEETEVWSGAAPVCEIVTCETLPDIGNGGVSLSGTQFGSVATYSCVQGYRV
ncbi:Sushi, von Willebrand factor type A, EGF and pentraxin domain-containing protein 1, partial [Geodia barretti]